MNRKTFPTALLWVTLFAGVRGLAADSPIATDRPSVTDSSIVVPAGSLQAENGLTETTAAGERALDVPETVLRFGMASRTELRLTVPDYFGMIGAASGFGDLALGMKQQLGPVDGFDASVVLTLSLPTGARDFTSHGYDPSVQIPWSRSISKNWTIAGMLSAYFPTDGASRNTTGETTFLFDRQLTKQSDGFVEYVGDFPQRGGPRHLIHIGGSYRPTPHQQIDLHGGAGLSRAAVDHFIGIGYSVRFTVLRH